MRVTYFLFTCKIFLDLHDVKKYSQDINGKVEIYKRTKEDAFTCITEQEESEPHWKRASPSILILTEKKRKIQYHVIFFANVRKIIKIEMKCIIKENLYDKTCVPWQMVVFIFFSYFQYNINDSFVSWCWVDELWQVLMRLVE